jgi:hypothetical protein
MGLTIDVIQRGQKSSLNTNLALARDFLKVNLFHLEKSGIAVSFLSRAGLSW